MNNPRLAARYAKSIIDLSVEKNLLEAVQADMKFIVRICKTNPDFVSLLRSPVINPTTKGKIISAILKNEVNPLTSAFIKLLVAKTRESNLPEIAEAFIDQYNAMNNIHKVKLTTAVPVSDEFRTSVLSKVLDHLPLSNIDLQTKVDDSLIGGFILETEGRSIDASILKDLKEIKMQFLNNDYMHRIR